MKRLAIFAALVAVAMAGDARAEDADCEETARQATSRANELFDFGGVKLIGFRWHEALPKEALTAHQEAVADVLSEDDERVARGNDALAALNAKYGKTRVDGIKRTRSWFGIWKGEARLLTAQGWYRGETTMRETQVALPSLLKRLPSARDVRLEGQFIPREGDAVEFTGTLDEWLRENTPDDCGEAAVVHMEGI